MFGKALGETNYSSIGDDISDALNQKGYFSRILSEGVYILGKNNSTKKNIAIYQKLGYKIELIDENNSIDEDNTEYRLTFSKSIPELN